jgi:hypothetical protein
LGPILHKRDTARAAIVNNQQKDNDMKTRYFKGRWIMPALGIGLVGGSLAWAAAYVNLERRLQSAEALSVTLERLHLQRQLSLALKSLHEGDVDAAAQRVDLVLCDSVLVVKSDLATADDARWACVQDAFARVARLRPRNSDTLAGATRELYNDQIEAERILADACSGALVQLRAPPRAVASHGGQVQSADPPATHSRPMLQHASQP